jgi:hypothetical protein
MRRDSRLASPPSPPQNLQKTKISFFRLQALDIPRFRQRNGDYNVDKATAVWYE